MRLLLIGFLAWIAATISEAEPLASGFEIPSFDIGWEQLSFKAD